MINVSNVKSMSCGKCITCKRQIQKEEMEAKWESQIGMQHIYHMYNEKWDKSITCTMTMVTRRQRQIQQ